MVTDFETGIAVGMLFGGKTGGNQSNGNLRAIIDNDGTLNVVIAETPENAETEVYSDFNYTYTTATFVKEIKMSSTSVNSDGSSTTVTKTQRFEQLMITELYDSNGNMIMWADCDIETGEIYGFYDINDEPIYINEWR